MAEVLPAEELLDEPSDHGSLAPGTRLGRYELLLPIARGGMARVWAARLHGQRGFQKVVALKTILPHLAREAMFERMFLDEARIASRVHHPNVCEIYELGEEDRTLYLAMEWVSGESFARLLRASGSNVALEPRVAARVVADACAGVHAAHELTDDDGRNLGVVHRDLSPHNVLLSADGVAKVADFGVAKALDQLHDATSAGQLKGKLAYMAPEQITGAAVDRRSDVFSLGCILYEATTGQRPFRGEGDHQVMHAVLKGQPTPPSELVRGYPPELEHIVQRALSPQPVLRYATAERMRFALEELLAKGPLVTQSKVAQSLRARLGPVLDKRRERIRKASTAGAGERSPTEPATSITPSNEAAQQRSGVQPAPTGPLHGAPGELAGRPRSGEPGLRDTHPPPPPLALGPGAGSIPGAPPASASPGLSPGHASRPSYPSYPSSSHGYAPGYPPPYSVHGAGPYGAPAGPGGAPPYAPTQPWAGAMSPHRAPLGHGPGPWPYGGARAPLADDRTSAAPATTGQYVVAAGVGVLVAGVIAVGAIYGWRARHGLGAPDEAAGRAAPAASASPTAEKEAAASGEITFETEPEDALLFVEGHALPSGAHNVPRPAAGTTVMVIARAPGRRETTRLVDHSTTSPVVLALEEAALRDAPKAEAPKAEAPKAEAPKADAPKAQGGSAPPQSAGPRTSPVDPALPDNPY